MYEEFWSWFASRAPALSEEIAGGRTNDVVHDLGSAVDTVDPRLAWELGPRSDAGNLSLTISAEGDPELRTIVDALFRYRPSILGWQLFQYRQRKPPAKLQSLLRSQGRLIDLGKSRIALKLSPSRERVNVTFRASDFERVPSEDKLASAFSILDGLLGEEMVETRIGQVELQPQFADQDIALLDLASFLDELLSA